MRGSYCVSSGDRLSAVQVGYYFNAVNVLPKPLTSRLTELMCIGRRHRVAVSPFSDTKTHPYFQCLYTGPTRLCRERVQGFLAFDALQYPYFRRDKIGCTCPCTRAALSSNCRWRGTWKDIIPQPVWASVHSHSSRVYKGLHGDDRLLVPYPRWVGNAGAGARRTIRTARTKFIVWDDTVFT